MSLQKWSQFTLEFFEPKSRPSKKEIYEWVESGIVDGKIINGVPYVDANKFAVNNVFESLTLEPTTGAELLS